MAGEVATSRDGIVFGRYLLKHPIGRGGMAEVWRARLLGSNDFTREIVVKRILPHLTDNPELAAMFVAEAKLCARLNHPNIVQVYELDTVDKELFLAMEYVPGVNLSEVVARAGKIPVGMAVQVVRDVCVALGYAHDAVDEDGAPLRIIHRDVSPSNVMVRFDGNIKLVDFGIAKVLSAADEKTRTGVLKGKLGYLSPEAATGEVEIDHRSDIFGAGVILHELISGRRLFKGRDDLHTLSLVRKCEVAAPSVERAEVPAAVDAICLQALARDRDARFATAGEMAQALTRVMRTLEWDELSTAAFLRQEGIERTTEPAAGADVTRTHTGDVAGESSVRRKPRAGTWALVAAGLVLGVVPVFFLTRSPHGTPPVAVTPAAQPPAPAQPQPAPVQPPPATQPPPPAAQPHPTAAQHRKRIKRTLKQPAPPKPAPNFMGGDIDHNY